MGFDLMYRRYHIMLYRRLRFFCLLVLTLSLLAPASVNAVSLSSVQHQQVAEDFPAVDPNYIYNQLYYMVTHFQRREAGYDNNLPVNVNGHHRYKLLDIGILPVN